MQAPRQSRLRRSTCDAHVTRHLWTLHALAVSPAAREEVSALVRALGATQLNKLPTTSITGAASAAPGAEATGVLPDPLILVDPDAAATAARGGGGAAARQFSALSAAAAALGGVPLVSYRWLHDSAGGYSLMPLASYIVSAQRQ